MTRGALQKRKRKQVGEAPESLPTRACRTCTKAEAVPGSGRDDPLPGTRWLLPRNVSACSRSRAAAECRSEEHTSELHHTVISYAVFCLKKKNTNYYLLEGFGFIQKPRSGALQESVLHCNNDYDRCLPSNRLLKVRPNDSFNGTVDR